MEAGALTLVRLVLALALVPVARSQTLELQLFGSGDDQYHGYSVDVDGDTAVIGRVDAHNPGEVEVLVWSGGGWTSEATLTASDGFIGDDFGTSVSLDGDTLVVGAVGAGPVNPPPHPGSIGAAYVFVRTPGPTWTEEAKIFASNGAMLDGFGKSVAISGGAIVVGSPGRDVPVPYIGSAYVFEWNGTTWSETVEVQGSGVGSPSEFGWICSMSGTTFTVNTRYPPADTWVFVKNGPTWVEEQRLVGQGGFGAYASIDGDSIAVGNSWTGVVRIHERVGSTWSEVAMIGPSSTPGDQFGKAVSLDGDVLVAGATQGNMTPPGSGTAYVFARMGTMWCQIHELETPGGEALDAGGYSVAVSGTHAVVGAPHDDVGAFSNAGSTSLFSFPTPPTQTQPVVYCTAGTSAGNCNASISAAGTPSATAPSGFFVSIMGIEGRKEGLFFYGSNGRQANSWGNGSSFQCVVPPVRRGGLLSGIGTIGACDGSFMQDLNARWCPTCPRAAHNPGAGWLVQTQFWYRDPQNTSNQTTSLSNAIEFCVEP